MARPGFAPPWQEAEAAESGEWNLVVRLFEYNRFQTRVRIFFHGTLLIFAWMFFVFQLILSPSSCCSLF